MHLIYLSNKQYSKQYDIPLSELNIIISFQRIININQIICSPKSLDILI